MKKQLVLFILSLLLSTLSRAATEINGIYYNLDSNNKTAEVTLGSYKYSGSVTIPAMVSYDGIDYSVTNIRQRTFRGCTELTQIVIPCGVTSIGEEVFYGCSALTSIEIPNSVTSIGNYAFGDCQSLVSISIPNSVTIVGDGAFWNSAWYNNQPDGLVYAGMVAYKYKGTMPSNTAIELKQGTLGITASAFSGCSGLSSITIPNTVKNIGNKAFNRCKALTSITIPGSVKSIGNDAFYWCDGLTSVVIYDGVISLGNFVFAYCSNLSSVTIPNSVESIGSYAFENTPWLNSQPEGIVYVGKVAYMYKGYMPSNTSIILEEGTTTLQSNTFERCSGLTSISIPASLTNIGINAFRDCTGLATIIVDGANSKYDSRENCNAIIETSNNSLIAGCKNTVIPNSVTSIGNNAFYNCSGLTSLTIPSSVTSIGSGAFGNCNGLASIVVDAGNSKYDSRENCNAIIESSTNCLLVGCKNTVIPNSVTSIGENVFYNCSGLTSISIPSGVKRIGSCSIMDCSDLTDVYCYAVNMPTTEKGTFEGVGNTILHVPASVVETYRTTSPWSGFKEVVAIDENVITDVTLIDSQQTENQDKVYWNGEEMVFPTGYENFDHELNFYYTKENGIYSDYCNHTLAKSSWNYPGELLSQLKSIINNGNDYDFSYGEEFDFVDGRYRSLEDSVLIQVSPTDADLTNADITLLNSKGEDVVAAGYISLVGAKRYDGNNSEAGLWVVKFKPDNTKLDNLLSNYDSEERYAVAVKDAGSYVASDYNLSLGLQKTKHAYDFNANDVSVANIHNRYIMPEQSPNGNPILIDDSTGIVGKRFCYELTWHPLSCDNNDGSPDDAFSSILFSTDTGQNGMNACDRHGHTITDSRTTDGIDNRHLQPLLSVSEFDCNMDGASWAKIEIEFPTFNENGEFTPIRGFFVTVDNHFGVEDDHSELNAWSVYLYKNVAKYPYNHGKKEIDESVLELFEEPIILQKGNKGIIYIKDARNLCAGDVLGFRVHAVNLDGTLTDPDGRAFYVKVDTNDKMVFNILTDDSRLCAVNNCSIRLNPSDNYKLRLTWRLNNAATPVEDFFDFSFSTNANAGINDSNWLSFDDIQMSGGFGPTVIKSIRAAIKPDAVSSLTDGVTYKVTMSIMREALPNIWMLDDAFDIDIKKAVRGDADGDGHLDYNDVMALSAIVVSSMTGDDADPAADFNGDGEVDINDITALIDMLTR